MLKYTGIGNRAAPHEILTLATRFAQHMSNRGYTLFTGDADGMDSAFWKGANPNLRKRFRSKDAKPWAYETVVKYLPDDRSGFEKWTPYVQGLLARNMMQVLGEDGDLPCQFVICYTHVLYYHNSDCGGTGYAIRCALDHNIPVFNLKDPKVYEYITKGVQ
jgi:hypothetical protein